MKIGMSIAMLLGMVAMSGCAEFGSPIPGADLFTKGNSTTVTLEGKGSVKDAVNLFRKVARADGGFIRAQNDDSASALFSDDKLTLQMTAEKTDKDATRVIIQSNSETTVARTFELGDRMLDLPLKVAGDMQGFVIVNKKRAR